MVLKWWGDSSNRFWEYLNCRTQAVTEPLIYFWTNLKPLSSITIIARKTHKLDPPTPLFINRRKIQGPYFLFRKLSFFQ